MKPMDLLGRLWKPQIIWKGDRCLALCISPNEILLANVIKGPDGKAQVEKFQRAVFEGPAQANFLETGFMQEKEKWVAGLQNAMAQLQVGSGQTVIVALSQHLALLRYFAMPKIPRRFWKRAIPQEAKKYIPFSFEKLDIEFQVQDNAGADDIKSASEVLFSATSNIIMEQVRTLTSEAGLELLAVEPMGCSATRFWQSMGLNGGTNAAEVVIILEPSTVRIYFCKQGWPVLSREVEMGKEAFFAAWRSLDLAGCVSYVQKQIGKVPIGSIKVWRAGEVDAEPWVSQIGKTVPFQVELWKPEGAFGGEPPDWNLISVIGAGARGLELSSSILLDLTHRGAINPEDKAVRAIWATGGALAFFILFLTFIQQVRTILGKGTLNRLAVKTQALSQWEGLSANEINDRLAQMKSKIEFLDQMLTPQKRAVLTHYLEKLPEYIPDSVWLESLNFGQGLDKIVSKSEMTLNGRALAGNSENDIVTIQQFKNNLDQDPYFSKTFKIGVSLNQSGTMLGGGTQFTVNCKDVKDAI